MSNILPFKHRLSRHPLFFRCSCGGDSGFGVVAVEKPAYPEIHAIVCLDCLVHFQVMDNKIMAVENV